MSCSSIRYSQSSSLSFSAFNFVLTSVFMTFIIFIVTFFQPWDWWTRDQQVDCECNPTSDWTAGRQKSTVLRSKTTTTNRDSAGQHRKVERKQVVEAPHCGTWAACRGSMGPSRNGLGILGGVRGSCLVSPASWQRGYSVAENSK